MGCVGSNSKKEPVKEPAKDTNPAGPGPSKEPSGISDPRNGSNIRASKLTEEQ